MLPRLALEVMGDERAATILSLTRREEAVCRHRQLKVHTVGYRAAVASFAEPLAPMKVMHFLH